MKRKENVIGKRRRQHCKTKKNEELKLFLQPEENYELIGDLLKTSVKTIRR